MQKEHFSTSSLVTESLGLSCGSRPISACGQPTGDCPGGRWVGSDQLHDLTFVGVASQRLEQACLPKWEAPSGPAEARPQVGASLRACRGRGLREGRGCNGGSAP